MGANPGASRRLRTAVDRSRDLAYQVTDVAAEALRARRDPAAVAERRYLAARRRLLFWSLAGVLLTAAGVFAAWDIARGEISPGVIGGLILAVGLWVYCAIGTVQAVRDMRQRGAVLRRLPPPQPQRRPVAPALRPVMGQLDAYSDALRQSIAMLDRDLGDRPGAVRDVREETIKAADAAEVRLRLRAAEVSALQRAATAATRAQVEAAVAVRMEEIRCGVDGYGRLVLAAADVSAAARSLSADVSPATSGAIDEVTGIVDEVTGRLTALAAGMRELVGAAGEAS